MLKSMSDELERTQPAACDLTCPRVKWIFRLLVFAQFLFVILIVATSGSPFGHWGCVIMTLSGIGLGIWALIAMGRSINVSPELKKTAVLKVVGPYRIVRHPMYLALLLFCGGFVMSDGALWSFAMLVSLGLVLGSKIYYEELQLRDRFAEYDSYAENTKRLIPILF